MTVLHKDIVFDDLRIDRVQRQQPVLNFFFHFDDPVVLFYVQHGLNHRQTPAENAVVVAVSVDIRFRAVVIVDNFVVETVNSLFNVLLINAEYFVFKSGRAVVQL